MSIDFGETDLGRELYKLRLRRDAQRMLAREETAAGWLTAKFRTPSELYELADEEPAWRVKDLWEQGHTALLFSEAKAGKTTFVHNLLRCMQTGESFLGMEVVPPNGNIVVYDCELAEPTLARWLRKLEFTDGKIHFATMRGRERHLDFRDALCRELLCRELEQFQPISMLVVDPIGAVLQSLGISENDNTEVGNLLRHFNGFVRDDLRAEQALLVHHCGHEYDTFHPRGASAFKDVPDVLWSYTINEMGNARLLNTRGRIDPIKDLPVAMDENHKLNVTTLFEDDVVARFEDSMPRVGNARTGHR